MERGEELKPKWPATPNILSAKTAFKIKDVISSNPRVVVSEKLDGSNLCISSKGWVGTRNVILIQDLKTEDLGKIKFNRASLSSLKKIGPQVEKVHQTLTSELERSDFQTLIYGEWLQTRTSRSQEDIFDYRRRHFKDNYFYAFGLGVYFEEQIEEAEKERIENKIRNELKWGTIESEQKNQLLLAIFGCDLKLFLNHHEIETVPLLTESSLDSVITNKFLIQELLNHRVEGFVLTSQNLILKWKFVEGEKRESQIEAIQILGTEIKDPALKEVISALEKIGLHQPDQPDVREPAARPERRLYARLLRSAETKFPKLEDQYDSSTSVKERQIIFRDLKKRLEEELKLDLELLGYSLEETYQGEIEAFTAQILTNRTTNWNKKLERKKKNERA